ncbi:MAG: beta-ketoacyl-[acyl-carrier-protein] synthase family protein [Desulfobulbaceae bacterium]|nr:beta-ketoacyl-[acyl-carrier-protein] synthase family protein [Desulfobulbaceae bacterium]
MSGDAVAISGAGCISAAGIDLAAHGQALAGKSPGCVSVPAWLFKTSLSFPVFAAPEDPLSPESRQLLAAQNVPDSLLAELSRTSLLIIEAALQALTQANVDFASLKSQRVGICLGTTVGCAFNDEDYYRSWRQGERPDLPPVLRYMGGNISSVLQKVLSVEGPVLVVTNACASGTDAIGIAKGWLETDRCDLAIAGGGDALSRIAYNGFASLMLADTKPCRPFDVSRQGLNLGEGAGVMILEKESTLKQRGGQPLGWVHGYGTASDAWHPTAPHPQGRGLQQAILHALKSVKQGIAKTDIALINAHGTGTPSNDAAETAAIAAVFADGPIPPFVSTKGITGHTLGAAGGLEAVFTLLALQQGITHGACRCNTPDPDFPCSPVLQNEQVALAGRMGISQSLAFGGGNSCLVLEAAS